MGQFVRARRGRGWATLLFAVAACTGAAHAQQEGTAQWRFNVGGYVTSSSPALSPDGNTVYVGVEINDHAGRVIAVAREGGSRWGSTGRVLSAAVDSSPAVGPDGTIYIGDIDGRLYALNPANGSSLWEVSLGGFITSSPAIGGDGTIYVGSSDGNLHAVAANGVKRWSFPTGGPVLSSPAIAADGTIHFGSYDRNLYAITRAGQEVWRFATGGVIFSSPAIGSDGTIYFGSNDQRLYAVAADGTRKWEYLTNGPVDASPALGADGTIYFAADRSFYALRSGEDGNRLRWKVDVNTTSVSSAAVRGDGTIIFGADDGIVRAMNPADGSRKWNFDTQTGADNLIESSPLVAPDGSIYLGSFDGRLYKINGNGSPLSAHSSWPGFRREIRRSGRAGPSGAGGQLANISTRAQAGGGRNLIAGFVVQAPLGRAYLVRAVGPGLAANGVAGFLADPTLDLFSGQVHLRSNSNWQEIDESSGFSLPETAAAIQAFALEPGSKDAAILPGLPSGVYSGSVSSADGRPGVALVEVYDVRDSVNASARLLNLSTRGFVGTGENLMIAGFVVRDNPMKLLLRAIGPGLAQFGVPGVLPQPRITVFSGATPVASNANWTTDGYRSDLESAGASVAAFPLVEGRPDSALRFEASPGAYTIQISGTGNTTGEAMVEIYVLP